MRFSLFNVSLFNLRRSIQLILIKDSLPLITVGAVGTATFLHHLNLSPPQSMAHHHTSSTGQIHQSHLFPSCFPLTDPELLYRHCHCHLHFPSLHSVRYHCSDGPSLKTMSSELKVHQTMSAATSYPCSTSQSEENTMERDDFDEFDLSNLCDDEPWTER